MNKIETILAHAGCKIDPETRAVVSPIHLSTTFERSIDGSYPKGFSYSRDASPNRSMLEETLATLEGGAACAAFSSGMAAAMTLIQALEPPAEILLADDAYHGVRHLAEVAFAHSGIRFKAVDMTDEAAFKRALSPQTQLVWLETPSNPLLKITDIRAIANLAKKAGCLVLVDNTWATPLLLQPLALGADFVLHSLTKYLAGHSDVLGGALVAADSDGLFQRIRTLQKAGGAVLDPFSAWLTLRGMRSMAARMRMQCANAKAVAVFLDDHPAVTRVHYPALPAHKGHATASEQMKDFGAMVSFEVGSSAEEALRVASRTRVFRRATSLGGTESLIEHRASIEAPPTLTPDTLLRISCGLEHREDLISDLQFALQDIDSC